MQSFEYCEGGLPAWVIEEAKKAARYSREELEKSSASKPKEELDAALVSISLWEKVASGGYYDTSRLYPVIEDAFNIVVNGQDFTGGGYIFVSPLIWAGFAKDLPQGTASSYDCCGDFGEKVIMIRAVNIRYLELGEDLWVIKALEHTNSPTGFFAPAGLSEGQRAIYSDLRSKGMPAAQAQLGAVEIARPKAKKAERRAT